MAKFHELSPTKQRIIAVCMVAVVFFVGMGGYNFGVEQGRARESRYWSVRSERDLDTFDKKLNEMQAKLDRARAGVPSPEENEKRASLEKRLDLIPVEASLGGTMRYFPDETRFFGQDLVYAYAEDGHNLAEMLLQYSGEGPEYHWELIAYNGGNGWQMAA